MSDDNPIPPSPTARDRRASFSPGQSLSSIFSRSPTNSTNTSNHNSHSNSGSGNGNGNAPAPGSIAIAAANAQNRRRMSINTMGLSGSPPRNNSGQSTSPFGSVGSRRASISSAGTNSASLDESVIEEGDAAPANTPATPFGRRMSFGARALRDVRQQGPGQGGGNGNGNNPNGRSPSISYANNSNQSKNSASSPGIKARGRGNEGFNWSENLRSRAERTSSISGGAAGQAAPQMFSGNPAVAGGPLNHPRAKSVAMSSAPPQEAPKQAQPKPDHFQERILKGDFYMD